MPDKWRECVFHPAPHLWALCEMGKPKEQNHYDSCKQDACRIPAQLEALEKARAHCGWLLSEYPEGGKPADIVESTRAVYDACNAALEQGEEHHG